MELARLEGWQKAGWQHWQHWQHAVAARSGSTPATCWAAMASVMGWRRRRGRCGRCGRAPMALVDSEAHWARYFFSMLNLRAPCLARRRPPAESHCRAATRASKHAVRRNRQALRGLRNAHPRCFAHRRLAVRVDMGQRLDQRSTIARPALPACDGTVAANNSPRRPSPCLSRDELGLARPTSHDPGMAPLLHARSRLEPRQPNVRPRCRKSFLDSPPGDGRHGPVPKFPQNPCFRVTARPPVTCALVDLGGSRTQDLRCGEVLPTVAPASTPPISDWFTYCSS